MKKINIKVVILAVVICAVVLLGFTGCNMMPDTTFSFERAVVALPNGDIIEGKVSGWTDFDNSDQIQVKIDGKVYLTHISNVVLISE